jgi:hypothetical protein
MRNNMKRNHPGWSNIAQLMRGIEYHDLQKNYEQRNALAFATVGLCAAEGLKVGIRVDPENPQWPVLYVELPTGQISWHLPAHEKAWDGHTTDDKYKRIHEFQTMMGVKPIHAAN